MSRVKRGNKKTKRRKSVLKQAKGYYGAKSRSYRVARQAVDRSLQYAYRDRRQRKREMRRLWIVRINAGARANGLSYNRLVAGLKNAGCDLNRKMLADLAVREPQAFSQIVEVARQGLAEAQPEAATAAEA